MIKDYARTYCRKGELHLIENYEEAMASSEVWECHHRLELTLDGHTALSHKDLIRHKMYYKRPAFELIFLSINDHKRLHWDASNETRRVNASNNLKRKWLGDYSGYRERLAVVNKQRATDPVICKKLSDAVSAIMSDPQRKQVFLDAQQVKKEAYAAYKANGGLLKWNEWARDVYKYREGSSTDIKLKRRRSYETLSKEAV